jgi:putative Ca2+/H+ antiporter (TMEM165/GDT1 family)
MSSWAYLVIGATLGMALMCLMAVGLIVTARRMVPLTQVATTGGVYS